MSDHWIILIPEKAGWVPTKIREMLAQKKLSELLPEAGEIKMELSEEMRFEHCGSNFESVQCPACGEKLETKWWQKKMDDDFGPEKNFKLAPIRLPCCGVKKTLHELHYEWQQGFAKFSLCVRNPNIGKMPEKFIEALETILNCKLRFIYRHI
jgi:hypothetical protein